MMLSEVGERKIIEIIKNLVRKGKVIADFDEDASIFEVGKDKIAVTTDMGSMSTHFTTEDPKKIGKKIVTSNVSDILAKGGMPLYMLTSIGFPSDFDVDFVKKLYASMDKELKKYGAYIIGGDTNRTEEFVYSITLIGKIEGKLLKRSNAKDGDFVVLTGEIGNAAAGYLMKMKKLRGNKVFLNAQEEPEINFELCKEIISYANAGIDISDGLAFELGEISRLSKKKIIIDFDKLPINPKLFEFCEKNNLDWKKLVFHMGEDYQIVYTTPKPIGIVIGKVLKGDGVFLVKDNKEIKLKSKGYEHFISN
ncbi:MAG: thiamine-phosphate kinase [Candidatus Aenigmarchaeota archaeon]|nr:thiamine-phosphate kinase [Candidatus Aenigmarchaeota archaeon]